MSNATIAGPLLGLPVPTGGDANRSVGLMVGMVIMTAPAIAIVWLRVFTRAFVIHQMGWDDWTMLIASVIGTVANVFDVIAFNYGLGRHAYYLTPDSITMALKWFWATEPTNVTAVYFVRLSICLSYLRIIPQHKKAYIRAVWTIIALSAILSLWLDIIFFVDCIPIQKIWQPTTPGKCINTEVYKVIAWVNAVFNVFIDLTIISIAIAICRNLNMKRRDKYVLLGLMCLGIFTCTCAIAKLPYLNKLFTGSPEVTWDIPNLIIWSALELCIGMIAGSVPALRPLFKFYHDKSQGYRGWNDEEDTHQLQHPSNGVTKRTRGGTNSTEPTLYSLESVVKPGQIRATTHMEIKVGGRSESLERGGDINVNPF